MNGGAQMAEGSVWPVVHAERRALAADLGTLTDGQWDTPSLCREWTVRDVVAHLTATAKIGGARFLPKLAASGFSLGRMQAKDIAVERGESPKDALARFEAQVTSTLHPPGPMATWLGEIVIHGEDIRRPLGMGHAHATEAVVRVAEFYKGSNLVIGAKRRIRGLTLLATDADWSYGQGPEVTGPVLSLLLAMTGRVQALDELSGEGVAVLRARA